MIRKEDLLQIGRFAKPHGIKGELSLITDCDLFGETDHPYLVCEMDGIPVPFYIESHRPKGTSVILVKLEHIDNLTEARRFAGRPVYCPVAALANVPEKDAGWRRFKGYVLEDERQGVIGCVTEVDDTTLNVLFHVNCGGKEILAPMAEELISAVDRDGKRLIVSLPDGLLNL
ncbi:MAG: ribosome maturation factor RimM [Tannerella sp.]|jgi:16S rRNA processing protein RimM|nr:ribosome maturation factor RimM [Tannerella sp.]